MSNTATPWVLIVDDEPEIRELLKSYVQDALPSARIMEAVDGRDALVRAGRQQFQVVVTDIKMPKLDGHNLIQGLWKLNQDTRPSHILAISGDLHTEQALHGMENVSFLPKPVAPDVFRAELQRIVSEIAAAIPVAKGAASGKRTSADFIRLLATAADEAARKVLMCPLTKEDVFLRDTRPIPGHVAVQVAVRTQAFGASLALVLTEAAARAAYAELRTDEAHLLGRLSQSCAEQSRTALLKAGIPIGQILVHTKASRYAELAHTEGGPVIAARYQSPYGEIFLEAVVAANPKN